MEFSINCMLITSDMEYLNSYLKYSFKVDDYYEDNNNHELEVLKVEEEYQESEEEEEYQESEKEEEYQESEESEEEEEDILAQEGSPARREKARVRDNEETINRKKEALEAYEKAKKELETTNYETLKVV